MKKTVFLLFLLLPFCYLLAQPPVPNAVKPTPFTAIAQPTDGHNVIDDNDYGDQNVKNLKQFGNDNYIWVDITGDKNGFSHTSKSLQEGNRNYADVNQSGDRNRFDITQSNKTPTYTSDRNKTLIDQSGDRNEAIVNQKIKDFGTVEGKLVAKSYQSGDGNLSRQEQLGKKNRELVIQKGDNGVAKQWQGQIGTGSTKSYYNSAVILQRQKSNMSRAYQYQEGYNNDALIIQKSDRSVAKQVQLDNSTVAGPPWNENIARITQRGDDNDKNNKAYQFQYYDAVPGYTVGNYAWIDQKGSNNVAWQVQLGGQNINNIDQMGDGNVTKSLQVQGTTAMPAFSTPFNFNIPASITP